MADNKNILRNTLNPNSEIVNKINGQVRYYERKRRKFEQRWYDNNFFDDGYHFRYVSRSTGKIIDLTDRVGINLPVRAIPKASRQIRGVANLLLTAEPTPVIYPKRIVPSQFTSDGQVNEALFEAAKLKSTLDAKQKGIWIQKEWDRLEMKQKLIHMVILAAKHSVSYMQVWADPIDENIKAEVFDAFEILLPGDLNNIYDSPSIIKATPKQMSQLEANELFDQDAVKKVIADNKMAASQVKQAYMQTRFNSGMENEDVETVIQYEAFIKEYLNEDNRKVIGKKYPRVLEGKEDGDMVMRHVFLAGEQVLLDEYVDLDEYPFVDFRFEPGVIYQKPFIENFIPANKSLDIAISRVERWFNTMVTGKWLKQKGSGGFQITNLPGGEVLEYQGAPPVQANIAPLPNAVFNYTSLLEKFIDEQGASVSALNQLPSGVRSGVAIESLKETEYANLQIPADMLKQTVERITQRMIDIAAEYRVNPMPVDAKDGDDFVQFNIIGKRGIDVRQENNIEFPRDDYTVISKDDHFEIETQSGGGFTQEGKRELMQQMVTFVAELAQAGYVNQEAVKVMVRQLLDTYQFGSVQEFMEAMDLGNLEGVTDQELQKIKIAVLEVLKDAGLTQQGQVDASKLGTLETLRDMGVPQGQ